MCVFEGGVGHAEAGGGAAEGFCGFVGGGAGGEVPGVWGGRVVAGDAVGLATVCCAPAAGILGFCHDDAAVYAVGVVVLCCVEGFAWGKGPEGGVDKGGVGEGVAVCGGVGEGLVEEGGCAAAGEVGDGGNEEGEVWGCG